MQKKLRKYPFLTHRLTLLKPFHLSFYNGGPLERDILTRAYLRLIKHVNSIYKIRIAYEWTEDFVIKYLWSAAGYGLIAVPLLITRKRGEGKDQAANDSVVADRTESEPSRLAFDMDSS